MGMPSDVSPDVWPDAATLEANAAGRLAPGQQSMPDGKPIKPPYIGLAIIAAALPVGAVLWWTVEPGMGIAVGLVVANFGLVAMSMNLDARRRRRRLREDLTRPLIRGGIGQVVAGTGGGVLIRAGSEALEPNPAAATKPAPGWYQMYWLEHPRAQAWNAGRVLLSARLIELIEPDNSPSPASATLVAQMLSAALGFTEDDLTHNRTGVLSPSQRRAVRGRLRGVTIWATIGILAGLSMVADTIAGIKRPAPGSPPRDEAIFAVLSSSTALAVIALTVWGARRRRRAHLAQWEATAPVARVTGPAVVSAVNQAEGDWKVRIGDGPEFHVATVAAQAFLTPCRYTVNYLPGKPVRLLSAEPVVTGGGTAEIWSPPHTFAATDAALGEELDKLAGRRRIRRALMAMIPALIVTAATALPYIHHHYDPRQAVLYDDATDLKITLIVVAVWVVVWTVYALSGRRRR